MELETAWAWFSNFGQFFVIVAGPVVIAALPILLSIGILLGMYFAFIVILDLGD
jgi:hypothetical protein